MVERYFSFLKVKRNTGQRIKIMFGLYLFFILTSTVYWFIFGYVTDDKISTMSSREDFIPLLLFFITFPIVEEILFRAPITYFITRNFSKTITFSFIVILTVIFSILHTNFSFSYETLIIFIDKLFAGFILMTVFLLNYLNNRNILKSTLINYIFHSLTNLSILLPFLILY